IETTNEGTKILATVDGKPRTISESSIRRNLKLNDEEGISSLPDAELFENLALLGYNILPNQKFIPSVEDEGSAIPTEPHHTPSPQKQHSSHHATSSPSHLTTITEPIPTTTPTEIPTLRKYSRRATRIAQSKALSLTADEPASLLRDDSQGEAFPTISGLDAGHDMENIIKTSSLSHESTPRVTSLDAEEGSMQQQLQELMDLCTSLQWQQTYMATKIEAQDLKISSLKARIKILEDKDRGSVKSSGDDALIKGRSMEIVEEVRVERSTNLGVMTLKKCVPPVAGISTVGVPTVSGLVPIVSSIFTTASVVTPYSRHPRGISAKYKSKEKVLASDAEIARIHAAEELKMLLDGLDRSNEVIAKHLQEYEESEAELTIEEKIKLINKLEQREFYMSVLRSHAGWKTKYFRGMTLEEIREKFIPVWKQIEDFVSMSSTEEAQRVKRKGLKLDERSTKIMKTSKDEEDLKGMMQLVPVKEVYVKALQVKHLIINWEIHSEGKKDYWKIIRLGRHTTIYQFFVDMLKQFDREYLQQLWALVKEILSIRHASIDKETELWVELNRMFEPDFEDQLWTHNQNLMHDPLDWKLYDTCGVHHVFTKDQEIFMLVERDYPLRRGLAIVMISNKLQVENYSQMANDLILKIHNIANSPR
nr:hypothetical protein [Tanacetum cinerariifolium]